MADLETPFMPALYAMVEAVAEGKLGEAQIEHRTVQLDGSEVVFVVEIRREARRFGMGATDA